MVIRIYEGSHILVLDEPADPKAVVLVRQKKQNGLYTTPGFGKRNGNDFDKAAIMYTKEQTGLDVGELELYDSFDHGGRPFTEPDGTVQMICVHRFVARKVEGDVRMIVDSHSLTDAGKEYQPRVVDLKDVGNMKEIDEFTPKWLGELGLLKTGEG